MKELKNEIEALLFASGRYMSLEEISKICKKDSSEVKEALIELTVDYENSQGSLLILHEGEMWKLSTREQYSGIVKSIVSETELTKSQIETLAVIAFKYPIKQSELIRIRTNKAYDHLMELEKTGFITRQRYGRSRLIKLTDKFFEYFDLPREKLKERFKGFEQLAETIKTKEDESEKLKNEQQKIAIASKEESEKERAIMNGELDLDGETQKKGEEENADPKMPKVQ